MKRVLMFARLGAVLGVFVLFGTLDSCVAEFCSGLTETNQFTDFLCGNQLLT